MSINCQSVKITVISIQNLLGSTIGLLRTYCNIPIKKFRRDPGSNQGPLDLQSNALPTELSRQLRSSSRRYCDVCYSAAAETRKKHEPHATCSSCVTLPRPGVEPGSPRPQRGILTTILPWPDSRLLREKFQAQEGIEPSIFCLLGRRSTTKLLSHG